MGKSTAIFSPVLVRVDRVANVNTGGGSCCRNIATNSNQATGCGAGDGGRALGSARDPIVCD